MYLGRLGTLDLRGGGRAWVGTVDPARLANGRLVLGTGAMLGNSGAVDGDVLVTDGADLRSAGWLSLQTISGTLTLEGRVILQINRTNSPTCDRIKAATIVFGGTLQVENTGQPLRAGDTFSLFDAPTNGGQFASLSLPALEPGLMWFTNRLQTDGAISVIQDPSVLTPPLAVPGGSDGSWVLSADVAGSEPIGYQWQYDGQDLAGETNRNLSLTGVSADQLGKYRLVVANSSGTNTSSGATTALLSLQSYAGITLTGTVGQTYRIEASTAPDNPTSWQTLTDLVLPRSPYLWVDEESKGLPKRLYRAVLLL